MVALGIAIFGGIYDCFTKRIPNWWTYSAIVVGLLSRAYLGGSAATLIALGGIAVAFLVYFPLFSIRVMGAGDVKLLMAVGAWTNYEFVLITAIAAILVGGLYAFIETLWVGRFWALFSDLKHYMLLRLAGAGGAEPLPIRRDRSFSFGLAIAAGAAMAWYRQSGGLT